MFQVIFHPSSGAHNTVSTVSGINETCAATCHELSRPATFTTGNSIGLINARYCRLQLVGQLLPYEVHTITGHEGPEEE